MPKDFRYIIQSVSQADVKDAISSLIFESIFWLWHAISFEMLIRVKCFQTDFRIWRTRSWRPTCGWSSTGATTSWPGSPRSMAGSRVSTCRRITSGDQTLSSTTSKQPQYSLASPTYDPRLSTSQVVNAQLSPRHSLISSDFQIVKLPCWKWYQS